MNTPFVFGMLAAPPSHLALSSHLLFVSLPRLLSLAISHDALPVKPGALCRQPVPCTGAEVFGLGIAGNAHQLGVHGKDAGDDAWDTWPDHVILS